jgi:HSP20 family protein
MDVPSFDKEDIAIEVKDGYLTIKAQKSNEVNEEEKNYIRKERSYGEYSRTFNIGDADVENIEAKFEKGTLIITMPKKAESESKKTIEIK